MDFQSNDAGSTPAPRSKDRNVGRWANCPKCGKVFASFKRKGIWQVHCSKSCAQQGSKKVRSKSVDVNKKRERGICSCGASLSGYKTVMCLKCYAKKRVENSKVSDATIEEVILSSTKYRGCNKYQSIRNHAKAIMRCAAVARVCAVCGYQNGIQVCHIRGISTFPTEATVGEINSLENLVYLCPNHHWELDHGLLVLP